MDDVKKNRNGSRLELAMITLLQTRADCVRDVAESRRQSDELRRQSDARYAEIMAVLQEHSEILRRLPDAIRDTIGFRRQGFTTEDEAIGRARAGLKQAET